MATVATSEAVDQAVLIEDSNKMINNQDSFESVCEFNNIWLTDEVLKYEPPPEAIRKSFGDDSRPLRFIFGDLPLDVFEKEGIRDLKVELEAQSFPKNTIFDDDRYKLRFLQGNKWVIQDCIDDMLRHLKWRAQYLPVFEANVKIHLPKGWCYIHGRDKRMRPIVLIRCKELTEATPEEGIRVVLYWLEFAIANLMVKNRVEQWRVIIDLMGCSTYNLPVITLKEVAANLTRNYRGRLNELIFVNSTVVLWGVWQVVSVVLPETTRRKITILTTDFEDILLNVIRPNQLEERLGGSCKDLTVFTEAVIPPGPFT